MSADSPVVTVVLPTYNRGDIITASIQSVLDQTYTDFELIVVDDASTDDTDEVVGTFDDNRITYLEHDENKGAPAARNTGIEASEGGYVAFQDSDDEWDPHKLERQMEAFHAASESVGVVYTGMRRIRDDKVASTPYPGVEPTEGDIRPSLCRQNFIPTQVALVRRECFERVGTFDENAWPLSDWELWIRISKQFQFEFVDEHLVTGEVRGDSISRDQRALVRARKRIIDKHRGYFDDASLARHSFFVGHGSMKLKRAREARKYLLQAIRLHPRPRYVLALLLSLFTPRVYLTAYNGYKNI